MNVLGAQPGSLLIRGGLVFDPGTGTSPRLADIHIVEGRIESVTAPNQQRHPVDGVRVLDASGQLVLPGFVNAHYHSHDVLLRGRFEATFLESWMLRALPLRYGPRSPQELYVRTVLGALDCVSAGITTVQDMLSLNPTNAESYDAVMRAYSDVGIRVVLAPQFADAAMLDAVQLWRESIPARLHALLDPYAGRGASSWPITETLAYVVDSQLSLAVDARLSWGVAASGPERCSPELLELLAGTARDGGMQFFSHVAISRAESVLAEDRWGGTAISHLAALGVLGPHASLAHCVWATESDVELLASTGTNVVTNPVSNLKNKNGVAPLLSLYQARVPLALGCDNCSCGDTQNMFGVMKAYGLLAGLQSTTEQTPTALDALKAATVGGARSVGLQGSVGSLAPGFWGDLVLLDLSDHAYLPLNSVPRQVVYAESGRGVSTVVVAGRVVVQQRDSTTFLPSRLRELLAEVLPEFEADLARVEAEAQQLDPYITDVEDRHWASGSTDRRAGRPSAAR